MTDSIGNPATAVAIVAVAAILPDAPDAAAFWDGVRGGRYSITDVTPDRWDPDLYFDPDPRAPGKTYSKIGGWVRDWAWDPFAWHLPIPPKVGEAMDDAQKWAVATTRMLLADHGSPLDGERTAVILGNALAGEKHYLTALRITFPEIARELGNAPSFASLPDELRRSITKEMHANLDADLPDVTEDTMPGELGNCLAGRIANLFDFRGPNFVVDAACASAMAAIDSSIEGLVEREYDTVIAGGIDRNMGASTYVKFCKIGALSATGTRPFDVGADGFVMGEGAALFLLKRLEDAERDGDRIYAVLRGVGGSSDGKGKGITAPNPIGQRLAVERAWHQAGLSPARCSMVEAHGTSTRVGDVVEVGSITEAFAGADLAPGSVALGSVKSNIGHLKGAAGAAGLLKTVLALHHKMLPPSLHFSEPNPNVDWASSPFRVNTELRDWPARPGEVRTAGVSAFGFGGTNFHLVLEEHVPGRLLADRPRPVAVGASIGEQPATSAPAPVPAGDGDGKAPLRGALVLGADDDAGLATRLREVLADAESGRAPEPALPSLAALRAPKRLAIDYGDAAELAERAGKARAALESGTDVVWRLLRNQGVFRGSGPPPKVAFLYTGQGSQYVNMLDDLRRHEPLVADTFAQADRVMTPLLGGTALTHLIFVDPADEAAVAAAEEVLRRTEITQPAVLSADHALTRLFAAYGIRPDMVMGHSLGEYGALVAAGVLDFAAALEAVSARGREMAHLAAEDPGAMAAVMAPVDELQELVESIDGYVVIANRNSTKQSVIGGATEAVHRTVEACRARGWQVAELPVSHAFHTSIVAPASEPLRATLERLRLHPPELPIVANVDGGFYPMGPDVVPEIVDLLARQVASPVQFVAGLRTLADAGARVFVEVGPKRALFGFAEDVLDDTVLNLYTNHPTKPDAVAFNQALCGLYAAGLGTGREADAPPRPAPAARDVAAAATTAPAGQTVPASPAAPGARSDATYLELGHLLADFLERAQRLSGDGGSAPASEPVVITGAALGLPGTERIFDDGNLARLLHGEQLIDVIPTRFRREVLEKHVVRLVKREEGTPSFEPIDRLDDVIKLAARGNELDLAAEFGIDGERLAAYDRDTMLAVGAGLDALRDAGIPLVVRYKTTTVGGYLPERWSLPEALRDDTGVIFASAFPGLDAFADDLARFWQDHGRRARLEDLEGLRSRLAASDGLPPDALAEVDRHLHDLRLEIQEHEYSFDRRFIFRILAMGHSQLAELVGARGPNTQVNAACASTTQAVAIAEDWIRVGRCRRVVIVAADDVTSDHMLGWIGAGFLASGAAATDDVVEDAALPFDQRRHGMILGMGAAAIVVESAASARERGITPICEVLSAVTANSAFHGTRLDVDHIGDVMERAVAEAEARGRVSRAEIAPRCVFVSHETYTPARGGSASAEVHALRRVFGPAADAIVVANTKGFTGHPMGVGIEDVVAVKSLETGLVPPVANFRDVDPELGPLNLSKGGVYPIDYALRLAAGFGSQISMLLLRHVAPPDGRRRNPEELGHAYRIADPAAWKAWLVEISGQADPELEVVQRTLRVIDRGRPGQAPRPSVPSVPHETTAATPPAEPVIEAPAAAQAAPAPVEPAPAAGEPAGDEVTARVVELVAEQTGYPSDMLDLDLDLEADLGIDTVKQAEVFATIREAYGIPRDDSLKLRDYPTLHDVIAFVHDRAPRTAAAAVEPAPAPAPAAPVPAEPAPTAAEPAGEPAGDEVTARVIELVAEQTGYPSDMLDLDLDLEADLGIDTVKQAEVFATIREAYGIPRDDNLELRDYPTLHHVIAFVHDRAPRTVTAAAEPAPPAEVAPTTEPAGFTRRVAVPIVRPGLDVCAPTGIELGAGTRVVLAPDLGGVADALAARLGDLGVEVLTLDATDDQEALERRLARWSADGPVGGVYWLPALDDEGPHVELDPASWREGLRLRVKSLAVTMRALAEQVGGPGTFLIAATRLGGRHGCGDAGATAPMGGAVTGFTKALARERADALTKAVDFEAGSDPATVAGLLVDETRRDPGVLEVGYAEGRRWSVGLVEAPAVPDAARALSAETAFVVTGAAGAIVSAIVADLAAATGGTFHLLDLIPAPDSADPDLARLDADRDGLKRDLAGRIAARGERATPVLVERELARLERARAALDGIRAVEAAGGTAHWHQVDLTDAGAVADAVDAVRATNPRVDVLLHCAGVEVSHFLPDKPQHEFDLVFDVKADGWFHLLHALAETEIGTAVAFSSIAARFGNGAQTDYSAANDLLCKCLSSFRTVRTTTRGVAIDWTAWADIGMATRGSVPKMMQLAGIDMLPPAVGVPVVRRELVAAGPGVEVVEAGGLGVLAEERDGRGGLDPDAATERLLGAPPGPMLGRVERASLGEGLVVVRELDPTRQGFLFDHRIDGVPVLPGVMGIEGFAEIAALLAPDLHVLAVENVDFLAPFKFHRDGPRPVELRARLRDGGHGTLLADCALVGRRTLPNQPEQVTVHFTGTVRLGPEPPAAETAAIPGPPAGTSVPADAVYGVYFHGPTYQVLAEAWRADGATVGRLADGLPPQHDPGDAPLTMAPRLLELCFQTAGVAELGATGRMALPTHVDRAVAHHGSDEAGAPTAVVTPRADGRGVDAVVVDGDGRVRVRLEGYRTVELPGRVSDEALAPLRAAAPTP